MNSLQKKTTEELYTEYLESAKRLNLPVGKTSLMTPEEIAGWQCLTSKLRWEVVQQKLIQL